jgi:hypothetical protein
MDIRGRCCPYKNNKKFYRILDAQHSDYFKQRQFNKYQFRVGRIVQGAFFNDNDYQSFKIVKTTKNYIEAYPIWFDGSCGDTRKFTKPSDFKRFKY